MWKTPKRVIFTLVIMHTEIVDIVSCCCHELKNRNGMEWNVMKKARNTQDHIRRCVRKDKPTNFQSSKSMSIVFYACNEFTHQSTIFRRIHHIYVQRRQQNKFEKK